MKATIEFNLPEENEEHELFMNGRKYYCALSDVQEFCRAQLKHSELTDNEERLLISIREMCCVD